MKRVLFPFLLILSSCTNQAPAPSKDEPRAPTDAEIESYLQKQMEENDREKQAEGRRNRQMADRIKSLERERDALTDQIKERNTKMRRDDGRLFRRLSTDTVAAWLGQNERDALRVADIETELRRLYELRNASQISF